MAGLPKQTIDIPFSQGLDGKSDDFVIEPGKLTRAENVRFRKRGRIQRRNGFVRESTKDVWKIFPHNSGVMAIESSTDSGAALKITSIDGIEKSSTSYHSISSAFVERSVFPEPNTFFAESVFVEGDDGDGYVVTASVVMNNSATSTTGDVILKVAYANQKTGTITHKTSVVVASSTSMSTSTVRAIALSDHTVVVGVCFSTSTYLYKIPFDGSSGPTLFDTLSTSTFGSYVYNFELVSNGDHFFAVYANGTTATANVDRYSSAFANTHTTTVSFVSTIHAITAFVGDNDFSGTELYVCTATGAANLNIRAVKLLTTDLSVTTAVTSVYSELSVTLATSYGNLMSGCGGGTHNVDNVVFLTLSTGHTYVIKFNSSLTGITSDSISNHIIRSRPYLIGKDADLVSNPVWYVVMQTKNHDTTNLGGSTMYKLVSYIPGSTDKYDEAHLLSAQTYPTYEFAAYYGACLLGPNRTPINNLHRSGTDANQFSCVGFEYTENDETILGPVSSPFSAHNAQSEACLLTFNQSRSFPIGKSGIGASTFFTGGMLTMYDGVEASANGVAGFVVITATASNSTGSITSSASYSIVCVIEYVDSQGNTHQSAPSAPITVAMGATDDTIAVDVRLTKNVEGIPRNGTYKAAIYRTVANGTTYYRDATGFIGSQLVFSTTITCTQNDTLLAANQILYTQVGEAENAYVDCPTAVCADAQRVYAVSGNNRFRVLVSKPLTDGYGIGFFPDYYREVSQEGGPITAIARMDGKLFAFKQRGCLVAAGDGPDITGQADNLGEFYKLSSSVGADNPASVLVCDLGIVAYGRNGFWLIGRDMQAQFIGAGVEDWRVTPPNLRCYGMIYNSDSGEIHCAMGDQGEWVYNVQFGAWSKNPTVLAYDIAFPTQSTGDTHSAHYICTDPDETDTLPGVYRWGQGYAGVDVFEDELRATAAENLYSMEVETGWLHLAGLQAFQRIYEGRILGRAVSTATIKVYISYDYVDTVVDTFTITSANATGSSSQMQFKFQPSRQKCQAMKIRIEDVIADDSQSIQLVGMSLVIGVKPGAAKLPASKMAT